MADIKNEAVATYDETLRRPVTLRQKLQLLRGKIQRFYVGHFRKEYVQERIAARKGECQRCGACCQLLVRCAFSAECDSQAGCSIYMHRPVNCRIYPLDNNHIAERDIVMPERPCGYYFED